MLCVESTGLKLEIKFLIPVYLPSYLLVLDPDPKQINPDSKQIIPDLGKSSVNGSTTLHKDVFVCVVGMSGEHADVQPGGGGGPGPHQAHCRLYRPPGRHYNRKMQIRPQVGV